MSAAHGRVDGGAGSWMDRCLPEYDATLVTEIAIDAPRTLVFDAIRTTNLLDPVVRSLFGLRELPVRLLARFRGRPLPAPAALTMDDLLSSDSGMVVLAAAEGEELVIGSIGRFWRRDYGHVSIAPGDFTSFATPGYAKLAMAFRLADLDDGRTAVRYEARTATTDEVSRRAFRRYWRVIRPGVGLVMRRALLLIRREAERRSGASRAAA